MPIRPRFWVASGLAGLTVGAGLYVAWRSGNWLHFARSGAVLVILGAVLAALDSLQGGGIRGELRRILSPDRKPSETLGLGLMVLGTLIWAFGDLVRHALR